MSSNHHDVPPSSTTTTSSKSGSGAAASVVVGSSVVNTPSASSLPDSAGAASSSSSSSFQKLLPPIVGRLERGEKVPVCVIVVGMAGSGKTTLLSKLQESLDNQQEQEQEGGGSGTSSVKPPPLPPSTAVSEEQQQGGSTTESEPPPAIADRSSSSNSNSADEIEAAAAAASDDDGDDGSDDDDLEDRCYCLNLDPATIHLPFECNIDIRDTVNYRQVMEKHQLGPNGAILTCLNLFATKFDQVVEILEKRAYGNDDHHETTSSPQPPPSPSASSRRHLDYILVDTPGQIEAFTWSASGSIVCQALASSFPTVLCFVVDTARCASSPNTFMSNMLYACSLLYRTKLPLLVCFNKSDVVSHQFCLEWMRDHEAFQSALDDAAAASSSSASGSGYYSSLTRSLSLVLDEFYSSFAHAVGVSAITGHGIPEFWQQVQQAARTDFDLYLDDVKCRVEEQQAKKRAVARMGAARLRRDVQGDS